MKITGARTEPFSVMRRRALAQAGAQARSGAVASADSTAFLGLDETDLTPAVQNAVQTLLSEIDDLRGEVGRLKAKLTEVEGLADRDALAPVLNRRALVREIGRIGVFAQRYGSTASLIYFDLDGFKQVNDRFGHAAGDAALKVVAERLKALMRDSDIVGRMGGDEFGVILAPADQPQAEAKAENFARALRREPLQFGDWSWPLHVSWGVRQIDPDVAPETIVAEADADMYARKRARGKA